MFTPVFVDGHKFAHSVSKVVCIGRNYAEHAMELKNPVPTKPLLFLKPASSVVSMTEPLVIPDQLGAVHHETELALLIGNTLTRASEQSCLQAIAGVGLALDLTLRDIQDELKSKRQPWDIAKGFDASCPVSDFVPVSGLSSDFQANFILKRNDQIQQQGDTADMLFPIAELISYMSRYFTLEPGDIVLTGTPKGVGPLLSRDKLTLTLDDSLVISTQVL